MNVINLDDYRPQKVIFSGKLKRYSIEVINGEIMLVLELINEDIRFARPLPTRGLHDLNRILINSVVAKIPIFIDAEYVEDTIYHIHDVGYYEQG